MVDYSGSEFTKQPIVSHSSSSQLGDAHSCYEI